MRTLLPVLLILLISAAASAEEPSWVIIDLIPGDGPNLRDIDVLIHDFATDPMDVYPGFSTIHDWGIMPPEARIAGWGMSGIMADVYDNGGERSNWASDIGMGFSFWDVNHPSYLFSSPFSFVDEGPGTFIQTQDHYVPGAALEMMNEWFVVPPQGEPFTFKMSHLFNDGSDLPAARVYGGVLYIEMDMGPVGVESTSFGALKALYR